jgi:hypothetical protein
MENPINDYPQKLYDTLANPDFREYLYLTFKEVEGDKVVFKLEINDLGKMTKEYSSILFEVARKEFELREK